MAIDLHREALRRDTNVVKAVRLGAGPRRRRRAGRERERKRAPRKERIDAALVFVAPEQQMRSGGDHPTKVLVDPRMPDGDERMVGRDDPELLRGDATEALFELVEVSGAELAGLHGEVIHRPEAEDRDVIVLVVVSGEGPDVL